MTLFPSPLESLSAVADRYPFLLCDVWGVIHNGLKAHAAAVEALVAYRQTGGRVILLTNAPMPASMVIQRLHSLGVDETTLCDGIVTSGSLVQRILMDTPHRVFAWGPPKDAPLYEGTLAEKVSLDEADLIVCTGAKGNDLGGDATWKEEARLLDQALARNLHFICANPDLSVMVGDQEALCAGKLALVYEERGGSVDWFGKPYAPVYEACFDALSALNNGVRPSKDSVLAIGDGLLTDMKGAAGFGLDSLLITTGLHGGLFGKDPLVPEADWVQKAASRQGFSISYFMPHLR